MSNSTATMDPRLAFERLITVLSKYSFRYATEAQLHQGIREALVAELLPFEHEKIDGANRYDFFCSGVVVEVKMDRSATPAYRQVDRYCATEGVAAVILVTTKAWQREPVWRTTVRGKAVAVIRIKGQAF